MKLFRVTLRGMTYSSTETIYGDCYVVANDPTTAYAIVLAQLEKEDIGFDHDRELHKIELLAEDTKYPNCKIRLYVQEKKST